MTKDTTVWAGIDIGDRFCQIALLDQDGRTLEESRVRTTPGAIRRYFAGRPQMKIAMEVGTHSL